jgi:putative transposase
VVVIPKYRCKVLYRQVRRHLGEGFRELARQKESRIEEGHLQPADPWGPAVAAALGL